MIVEHVLEDAAVPMQGRSLKWQTIPVFGSLSLIMD